MLMQKCILLQEEQKLTKEELDCVIIEWNNKVKENLVLKDKIRNLRNIFEKIQFLLSAREEKLENLLLYTDAKFMPPPKGGERNLRVISRAINKLRKIKPNT